MAPRILSRTAKRLTRPSSVTVVLNSLPLHGKAVVFVRAKHNDKEIIDRAADLLGLRTTEFSRMVLVHASRQIVKLMGYDE